MPYQLADFGTKEPSIVAMAQQLAIIRAIYNDNREMVGRLLGGEGEILVWFRLTKTWPPSYALMQSGPKRFFLAISGTTRWDQGLHQAGPTSARVNYPGTNVQVGMIWQKTAVEIWDQLKDRPDLNDPDAFYFLSGHSYGGAVAQLLANELAKRVGAGRVQLMTFGQPSPLTEGYKGPSPAIFWRVNSPGDFVPSVPVAIEGVWAVDPADSATWVFSNEAFKHYGQEMKIWDTGSFDGQDEPSPGPQPNVVYGAIAEHYTENYLGRVRVFDKRAGSQPAAVEAINLALQQGDVLIPPGYAERFTLPDTGLPPHTWGDFINLTNFSDIPPSRFQGSMAYIKHTWVFHGPDSEIWTETYTVNYSGSPQVSVDAIPQTLIDARRAVLDSGSRIKMIRGTDTGTTRASGYRNLNLAGTRPAADPSEGPSSISLAAVWTLRTTGSAQRKVWFRGLRDADMSRTANGLDVLGPATTTLITAFLNLAAEFGYGVRPRARPTLAGAAAYRLVTKVDGASTPGYSDVYSGNLADIAAGDFVTFSLFSKKDLPNFNQIFQVVSVAGTFVRVSYTTPDRREIITPGGRMRKVIPEELEKFAPAKCFFSHQGARQTHRGFTRSRGASRAARIRHLD